MLKELELLEQKYYLSKEDKIKIEYKKRGFILNDLQVRYLKKGIRFQIIWDIETSDFNPLGNFIIGYAAVIRDILNEKPDAWVEDSITKEDIYTAVAKDSFNFDYRLLQTLSYNLHQAHHAIGHYSTKFDMPYFRTRCMLTKQNKLIPEFGYLRQGDTWRYMKTTMKAPRNSLMNLALYTGIPNQKTHVNMEHWKRIYFPTSPKWKLSMHYIMDHCRKDVNMTLKAVKKIEKFNTISVMLA